MIEKYERFKEEFPEDFLIRHKITNIPEKTDFHIHDVFEMIFLLSNGAICSIGDKKHAVSPNSIILFNNMDLHYLTFKKTCRCDRYVIYFKPEYIEALSSKQTDLLECFFFRPFPDGQIIPLDQNRSAELLPQLEKILKCQNVPAKKIYGHDLLLKFLLGELLLFVNSIYREYHNISLDNIHSDYSLIYPIINYIHRNLEEELSLEHLAQNAFINKHYLCALFKNVTGMSPIQYIINCRVLKAKDLLARGISVDEVCSMVGYNNLSHFSRTFKQHTGLSPKKYALQNMHA